MDKEILEILKSIQNDIKDLKEGQQRIEKKLDITYDQVARTAENITSIKKDLSTVETVTAKNCYDITALKAIK